MGIVVLHKQNACLSRTLVCSVWVTHFDLELYARRFLAGMVFSYCVGH